MDMAGSNHLSCGMEPDLGCMRYAPRIGLIISDPDTSD